MSKTRLRLWVLRGTWPLPRRRDTGQRDFMEFVTRGCLLRPSTDSEHSAGAIRIQGKESVEGGT